MATTPLTNDTQGWKKLDRWLGNPSHSIERRVHKLGLGLALPLLPVLYAAACFLRRQAEILGMELQGPPAIIAGIIYLALALLLHARYFWGDMPRFRWTAETLQALLLIVMGVAGAFLLVGLLP